MIFGGNLGGCGSPKVECWASAHWVVGSNPFRGMFHQ